MNFFLIVTLLLVSAFMAMMVLRRKRKNASRSGRYRSPSGGGLLLERPGRRGRKLLAGFKLQPGHVFLALALVLMASWLGAGYFLADGEGPVIVAESKADAALPEQYAYLGGRLSLDASDDASSGAVESAGSGQAQVSAMGLRGKPIDPAVQSPGQGSSSILMAAHSVLPTESRLDQVGLMPARATVKKEAPAKAAAAKTAQNSAKAKAPAAPKAAPAASAAAAKVEAVPAVQGSFAPQATAGAPEAVRTSKNVSSPSSAKAVSAAQEKPKLATSKPAAQRGLLAASRQYTVHLGSFGEKGNAEHYLTQLVDAGEQAFISESTVDGRLWHRVMSGRFSSRDEAENYGRNLKKRGLTVETGRYLVKSID